MIHSDHVALQALERRLDHAAAIARLIGEATERSSHDGDVSEAIFGIASLIGDASQQLAAITAARSAT